jgi:hypothetical protein
MARESVEVLRLAFEGTDLVLRRGTALLWTVPLESVRALGEATNASGPWGDDWLFIVITGPDPAWFQAPVDAEGVQEVLQQLALRLGEPLELQLANSTTFRSRGLWPTALRGRPLFALEEPEPVHLGQRVLKLVRLWPWSMIQSLTPEVRALCRA